MTRSLTIHLQTAEVGVRNPTLRLADMLEVYAQELRDQAAGGMLVTAPGYQTGVNRDTLEVLNELS